MRAFVEEAAGISRYKERRKETESRIAETRENLERLQDVRDEVEKQIRHLQRQAATARRYQALKEEERRLTAELLALRLKELDSGAQVHDSATRAREIEMQAALADQRAAEAVDREPARAPWRGERAGLGRSGPLLRGRRGDLAPRADDPTHPRAAGAPARRSGEDPRDARGARRAHRARRAPARGSSPRRSRARRRSSSAAQGTEAAAAAGAGGGRAGARRLAGALGAAEPGARRRRPHHTGRARPHRAARQPAAAAQGAGRAPDARARGARGAGIERAARASSPSRSRRCASESEALANALRVALEQVQSARGGAAAGGAGARVALATSASARARSAPRSRRCRRPRCRRAPGRRPSGSARSDSRGARASRRRSRWRSGWELAVETALGDYLEAVCVDSLDELVAPLERLARGRVALFESAAAHAGSQPRAGEGSLSGKVSGPAAVLAQLAGVLTAESLAEALQRRAALAPGESVITRGGEWLGRDWLRVSRGVDHHLGVIEREHRLKVLRSAVERLPRRARTRRRSGWPPCATASPGRRRSATRRSPASSPCTTATPRSTGSSRRRAPGRRRPRCVAQRIEAETAEHEREIAATEEGLGRAGETLEQGLAVGTGPRPASRGARGRAGDAPRGARLARARARRRRRLPRAICSSASSRAARPKPR